MFTIVLDPTLSGGTSVTLKSAGVSPGQSVFVTPDHGRLTPETVKFTVSPGTPLQTGNPGVARTGLQISFASREQVEGCCTVKAGAVIADLGIRWNLEQSQEMAERVVSYLRAVVLSDEFETAVTAGILPS